MKKERLTLKKKLKKTYFQKSLFFIFIFWSIVGIGNGWVDPPTQCPEYATFANYQGWISDAKSKEYTDDYKECLGLYHLTNFF